jgi:hypothetical protein
MDDGVPAAKQPILIYGPFAYPQTKKFFLDKVFRTDNVISQENLKRTTTVREELFDALLSKNSASVIKACERYFPLLFGLVVAVESNPQLRLNEPLSFAWSSMWDTKNKPHHFVCYTYKYEVIMSLIAYAVALVNRTFETMLGCPDSDFAEKSKNGVTWLRTAAGVLQYIVTKEIPRWPDMPEKRPFELNVEFLRAFADYWSALAQMLMIKKGLLGGTSEGALAKLAVDVWNKFERTDVALKKLVGYKDELPSLFRNFLTMQVTLAKANAYKFLGVASYQSQKYGIAVTFLQQSSLLLKDMWTPTVKDFQGRFVEEIQHSKDDIEHVKRTYENENNHIYYHKLVEPITLEIPDGKDMTPPIEFIPPQPDYKAL